MKRTHTINHLKRTIMIVDDELINLEILKEILSEEYEVLTAENGKQALDTLHSSLKPVSLILLDINMPVMDGLEFLEAIKGEDSYKNIPIIVLTAEKDNELKSIKMGAVDFIPKPYDLPEVILARVTRSIELSEGRLIIQAAGRDSLTNVYNEHIFIEYVHKMDQYQEIPSDLFVIDFVHFHLFNELNGREKGDEALISFANILMRFADNNHGIVGRLPSNQFVVYVAHQENYDALSHLFSQQLHEENDLPDLRFHIGVYSCVDKNDSPESRIEKAKHACEEIKSTNADCVKIYDDEEEKKLLFQERLTQDFFQALEQRQFTVYYQPKVNIQGEKFFLTSAEALVRWVHPTLGFISPGVFVPLFEKNGYIRHLDHYVWRETAHQIAKWKREKNITLPISINISRVDLDDPDIVKILLSICEEANISPDHLPLEVTESAYVQNEETDIVAVIEEMKKAGFRIEIDDFGAGYSSLNTLASLPLDILKLDMKFVREMEKSEKALKMVSIVADIARSLKVKLVAEGVETLNQVQLLKGLGYDIIQGYYFSKPLKASDFEALFEKEFN